MLMWLLPSLIITTEKINNVSSEALGDGYRMDAGNSSVNLFRRSVGLQNVVVLAETGDTLFTAQHMRAGGIGLFAAINGDADVNSIQVTDFKLYEEAFTASFGDDGSGEASARIGGISLENGEVVYRLENGDLLEATGLYFSAASFEMDPDVPDGNIPELFSDSKFLADRLHITRQGGLSFMEVRNVVFDESYATFSVGSIEMGSHLSDQEYFAELEYRQDYIQAEVSKLNFSGIDIERLQRGEGAYFDEMEVKHFDLHITASLKLERDPDRVDRTMPLKAFHELPIDVSIDRLFFHDGDIRYSEYAADGVRPGTIHFGAIEAEVMDVQNLNDQPMLLNARTMLEGTGEVLTNISIAWRESGSHFKFSGGLGLFEVASMNAIFEDLEGVRIKDGTMDFLQFEFVMTDQRADGSMQAKYRDLSIELIDKGDHEQDLGNFIGSLLADEIVIRANSGNSGEDTREGVIDNEYDPENSFFTYLWVSLRSGIFDIVSRV